MDENAESEGVPSGSSAMSEGADLGHDPAQGPSTQGDGQSVPSEAPDGPKTADDSTLADEPQESVWDKVLRHRYMPSPLKRFAERRLSMAYAEEWRQSASKRDPAQNAATRLPPGEQAQVPVIWLAEIFTPTTIDGLVEGIRQLAGKPTGPYSTDSDDLIEWIRSSRREGFTAYSAMPIIAPKGSRIMNRIEDKVPSGISYVNPCLYTLTPTVTVMVASFRLQDDRASGLETILNQDMTTKIEWSGRSFGPLSVGLQKDRATDEWRASLRHQASCWLEERFPGSFHKLAPGELPTIEFLLTGQYLPWEQVAQRSDIPEWAGILDVGGWFGYWQSNTIGSLRLSERHARARKSDRHSLVLATTRSEVLKKPKSANLAEAITLLGFPVSALLVRWSLSSLLRELEEQLPSIQDAADRASRRTSSRALRKLQEQLLSTGIDSRIVVNDIIRYTENPMWNYEVPDFMRVTPSWRNSTGEPTVTLREWLRQGQSNDGRRVLQMEADLSEVLNTNAGLVAARASLRLAWVAIWVAVIAAIAAVIAIWPHVNASTPAPIQTPQSQHTMPHVSTASPVKTDANSPTPSPAKAGAR